MYTNHIKLNNIQVFLYHKCTLKQNSINIYPLKVNHNLSFQIRRRITFIKG